MQGTDTPLVESNCTSEIEKKFNKPVFTEVVILLEAWALHFFQTYSIYSLSPTKSPTKTKVS
jgi:hypothetical protein